MPNMPERPEHDRKIGNRCQCGAEAEVERLRDVIGRLYVARGGQRVDLYEAIRRAFHERDGSPSRMGEDPSTDVANANAAYAWERAENERLTRELNVAKGALELVAAPCRPDGSWNRDREACRQIAQTALEAPPCPKHGMYDVTIYGEHPLFSIDRAGHTSPVVTTVTDEMVKKAARRMRDEFEGWMVDRPETALFDFEVAARNALTAALHWQRQPEMSQEMSTTDIPDQRDGENA